MLERASFWRRDFPLFLFVSVLALLPCFWLPRIEAGDLASHSYNAWLTSLVEKGQAPGLWLAPQNNNILFDILLLRLGILFGFPVAEKVAVCLAVLLFLWGAFAFISSVTDCLAWPLLPLLLMLTYGWTFHMGFFNFYLSLGLAFLALAIFWRARGSQYPYLIPLAVLMWLAHPLGVFWFLVIGAYVLIARELDPRLQPLLLIATMACILALRFALARLYHVAAWRGYRLDLLGTDQIVLGSRYEFLRWILFLAILACVLLNVLRMRREGKPRANYFLLCLQLFLASLFGLLLLPDAIWLPFYHEPIALLISRFTLAIAVLGCCLLNSLPRRALFGALTAGTAVFYFALVYQDAAKTYAMEAQAQSLVASLPQDSRVITTIYPFRGFRVFVHHIVDRACIAHCFDIDNYEPATTQFRLRASNASRLASANSADTNRMMLGDYSVKPEDLPLFQIFQCGPSEIDLCLRPLHPGPLVRIDMTEIIRAPPHSAP